MTKTRPVTDRLIIKLLDSAHPKIQERVMRMITEQAALGCRVVAEPHYVRTEADIYPVLSASEKRLVPAKSGKAERGVRYTITPPEK